MGDLEQRLADIDVTSIQAHRRWAAGYWEVVVTALNRRNEIERGVQYESWRGRGTTMMDAIFDALRVREEQRNLPPA